MKASRFSVSVAVIIAGFMVTGCETTSDRIREKYVVYDALSPTEKRQVAQGLIVAGFTRDMVYMAIGRPSKVELMDQPESKSEMWTYRNYYPSGGTGDFQHAPYRVETAYQSSGYAKGALQPKARGTPQSIFTTGPPQGGSMEPADLRSYTLTILFTEGKVSKLGLKSN